MQRIITESVDASYSRLEDRLQATAVIPADVEFTVVVNNLSEEFGTDQINFKSKSFKTCLFKNFGTKLRTSRFRGWEIITQKGLAMADTALTHDNVQVLLHYAVQRDSSQWKDFILTHFI